MARRDGVRVLRVGGKEGFVGKDVDPPRERWRLARSARTARAKMARRVFPRRACELQVFRHFRERAAVRKDGDVVAQSAARASLASRRARAALTARFAGACAGSTPGWKAGEPARAYRRA
jgi:hypothetical protein